MSRSLLKWNEWSPGLDTDHLTMGQVMSTLPASPPEDVPEIIRRYENPESPDALPGAISLKRHDCIHAILGRGLHVQDEAFVIGVTMGAASDMTAEHTETFIRVSTQDYPAPWRFTKDHIMSYRLGVGFAMEHLADTDLHLIPLEGVEWQARTLGEIRKYFGLVKEEMRAYYRSEEMYTPGTRATRRLDTCKNRFDHDIVPEG